jgi:hypothetical protein
VVSLESGGTSSMYIPTINSLFDQSVSVDEIVIFSDKIDKSCLINNYVAVYPSTINNVLYTLQKENVIDTIIIFVGYDVIYSQEFIEDMVDYVDVYPDRAICIGNDSKLDVRKGVVLKPKYLKPTITQQLIGIDDYESINSILANNLISEPQFVKSNGNYKTFI